MPGCLLDVVGRSNTLRPRAAEQRCLFHALASGDESNGRVLHQQTSVVISLSSTYHTTTHTHSLLAFRNPRAPRACVYIHTQTHKHAHSVVSLCSTVLSWKGFKIKKTQTTCTISLWKGNRCKWIWCEEENHSAGWIVIITDGTLPGF